MATERQISANRANASKSTGPKSVSGKRKSSGNGIRHGILAQSIVLEGESVKRFRDLLSSLHGHFQPGNAIEANLVDSMAVARWRQMRLWALEKARLNYESNKEPAATGPSGSISQDGPTRVALAFQSLSDTSRTLELINRYETCYDRQFSRALNNLLRLREKADFSKRTQFENGNKSP